MRGAHPLECFQEQHAETGKPDGCSETATAKVGPAQMGRFEVQARRMNRALVAPRPVIGS